MENKAKLLLEQINLTIHILEEAKKIGIEKLPYSDASLQRFIDSKTMDIHYNKHYKGYVEKLNKALAKKNYGDVELENIIKSISRYDKTIRNNGGGAFNHALFWKMLSPKKQEIPSQIKSKIIKEFGSIKEFENKFGEVAKERFGSGWCWLVLTKNNRLKIMSTPNQDNPLMNVVEGGGFPLLGLDLWEHAYYLKYQNKRDEYIKNFWNVVNWEFVNKLYTEKTKTKLTESVKTNELIKEEIEVLKSNGRLNPAFVQTMLKKVYPKCSPEIIKNYNPDTRIESPCYGKIKTDLCETNFGVIGGKYAVSQRGGTGEWSVLNWFDANTRVSDMILDLYKKFNRENLELESWLRKMSKTLLGEDGKFTPKLADLILNPQTQGGTLNRGIEREKIAIDILNSEYKDSKVNQFCDGDIRDKYNGQDMFITKGGVNEYIQVKPTIDLYESKDNNGNTIYIFKSKNIYKSDNIQIFAFIDNRDNYIFFDFDKAEVKDEGGGSKERYSYIFKPESKKFQSPTIKLKKIDLTENFKKRTFKINEQQFKIVQNLFEAQKHVEYEKGLTGKVFEKFQTSLRINFKCSKDMFNYISLRGFKKFVNKVYEDEYNQERIIENLIVCTLYDLDKQTNPLKADLKAKVDGFDENGELLFSAGTYVEVKMMDVDTDSFLSEALSIFKNSKKEDEDKIKLIPTYNYVIKRLYDALKKNEIAEEFLGRIKSNLSGVIFDNNIFVPIRFIKLYWSDKGQRGCDERRLSIRFKVLSDSDGEKLKMYQLDPNSNILKDYNGSLASTSFEEIGC